jgi:hypothetical protein
MTTVRTGEPRLASVASWAVLVASFGLSATTWIALARLAGFTATVTVFGVRLAMAWLMPVAVDGYVVVALVLWMAPVPTMVATFARKNTYLAAGIGIAAQSAYHLLFTLSTTHEVWRVVLAAIVGAIPPTVAGLAVHMRALIRRESGRSAAAIPTPAVTVTAVTPTDNRQSSRVDTAVPSPADAPAPSTLDTVPSPMDTDPVDPAPAPTPVPSPAVIAARITAPHPTPTAPAAEPRTAARTTRPRPSRPNTPAAPLAPSTTDSSVTASDAAQPALPIVAPELLARARRVAAQYRTEHGTPITAGQLAVRLKVTSEHAAQALALLNLAPGSPTSPIPTVNGARIEAPR